MVMVMRKTPASERNDDCGWGPVGVVLLVGALVGALVVPKIGLTANQSWSVHWRCPR